jgi:hypothetical protein
MDLSYKFQLSTPHRLVSRTVSKINFLEDNSSFEDWLSARKWIDLGSGL